MTSSLDTNVISGMSAKGIWIDWSTLSHSFRTSNEESDVLNHTATAMVGTIAKLLVINALIHLFSFQFRNPLMITDRHKFQLWCYLFQLPIGQHPRYRGLGRTLPQTSPAENVQRSQGQCCLPLWCHKTPLQKLLSQTDLSWRALPMPRWIRWCSTSALRGPGVRCRDRFFLTLQEQNGGTHCEAW